MSVIEKFEDIEAWKKARTLTSMVYKVTSRGEFARDYGLRDQMRRASVSVLSNIAEGFEREGNNEFCQFLALAKGSCGEVRAQLYVALDQHYITDEQFESISQQAVEVSRIISGFMKYLRQSQMRGAKYK
jgi:four helix bundle protein